MAAQNPTATNPRHHSTRLRELDESVVVVAESPTCAVVLAPGELSPDGVVLPLVFDGAEEEADGDEDEDEDEEDEVLEAGKSQSPLIVDISVSFVISTSFVPQLTY